MVSWDTVKLRKLIIYLTIAFYISLTLALFLKISLLIPLVFLIAIILSWGETIWNTQKNTRKSAVDVKDIKSKLHKKYIVILLSSLGFVYSIMELSSYKIFIIFTLVFFLLFMEGIYSIFIFNKKK